MSASDRCGTCKHSAADPDGLYCGHEKSIAATKGFGQGIVLARSKVGVCGTEGKLYERCACTRKGCPRHGY